MNLLTKFASRKLAAMPIGAGILQYLISVGVPPDYATAFAAAITIALIAGQTWVDVTAAKATGQKPDLETIARAAVDAYGKVAAGEKLTAEQVVEAIKNSGFMSPVVVTPPEQKKSN